MYMITEYHYDNGYIVGKNATQALCQRSSTYADANFNLPSGKKAFASASGTSYAEAVVRASTSGESGDGLFWGNNMAMDTCWDNSESYDYFSWPINICAVPTNFRATNSFQSPDGTLNISYAWGASTGSVADLSACQLAEYVVYPGGNPYTWPRPPFGQSGPNPATISGVPTSGYFLDQHKPPSSWIQPYIPASFTANQVYQYVCPCANGGNQVHLGEYSITRSVTQRSDGWYKYTVTKSSGESATLDPLP